MAALNARVRDLTAANDRFRAEQQRVADQLKAQTAELEAARNTTRAPAGWTQERDKLRGLRIVEEPPALRHFSAKFEEI